MNSERSRRQALRLGGGLLAGGALLPIVGAGQAAATPDVASDVCGRAWREVPRILHRIRPPVFPRRIFDVTRFGAVGDGTTDCTEAFRRAIDACHLAGGGRVLVPPGAFLTGAIHLRSNVNLHVTAEATIRFHTDPARYLPVVFTRWEGTECFNYSPFIYANGQRNLAVTGDGTSTARPGSARGRAGMQAAGHRAPISESCAAWATRAFRSPIGSSAPAISCARRWSSSTGARTF